MCGIAARASPLTVPAFPTEHDLVLSWSKAEKRLRELVKDNRYLNPKEKDHYADYLESISAPQHEIDTQRKLKRQRFIEEKREPHQLMADPVAPVDVDQPAFFHKCIPYPVMPGVILLAGRDQMVVY